MMKTKKTALFIILVLLSLSGCSTIKKQREAKEKSGFYTNLYNMGVASYNSGNYESAISSLTKACGYASPEEKEQCTDMLADAYLAHANELFFDDDNDAAGEALDDAIRLKANNPVAYAIRGQIFLEEEAYDEAISDFETALLQNIDEEVKDNLSPKKTTSKKERLLKKEVPYENLLKPGATHSFLAQAYYLKGNVKRAINYLSKSLKVNPKYAPSYVGRGQCYYDQEDYNRALKDARKAVSLDKSNSPAHVLIGKINLMEKQPEKAVIELNTAIEVKSDNPDAFFYRGNAYFDLRDYGRARDDFEESTRLAPNFAEAYFNLGIVNSRMGDTDRAIESFEQVLSTDGATEELRAQAEEALEKLRG